MTKGKLMESTANKMIRLLKSVMLYARDKRHKKIDPEVSTLRIASTEGHKVFLSFDELEQIKNAMIVGDNLMHARDWLVIGCYTGQRASDLLRMNKGMIYTKTDSEGESHRLIELIQQKTKKSVAIPIHTEVERILTKYGGDFPPTFGAKGDSKFTLFNRYIKKVCEIAGINEKVKGRVYDNVNKCNTVEDIEKYKVTSSHVCRRSFATNFYGDNRFSTPQLMSITGHKSESTFLAYIGKTSTDHALKTAKTFKEIENEKLKNQA